MANDSHGAKDGEGPAQYSSPPCFMHELDPEFRAPMSDWTDVRRWRKAERERLIAARLAVSADARPDPPRVDGGTHVRAREGCGRRPWAYLPEPGVPPA